MQELDHVKKLYKDIEKISRAILVIFIVAVITFFILLLSGCGHNAVNYSDGVGFETICRPDTGNFGFVFRYGKILSVTARENTEVEMAGDGKGGASAKDNTQASTSSSINVKIKIGRQITGYYVDALKAGAKAEKLDNYLTTTEKVEDKK